MYWYYIQPSSIQLNSEILYGYCNKKSIQYPSFYRIKLLLISAIKKYIDNLDVSKKNDILLNINQVLQKTADIDTLNSNKKIWSEHNLDGLFFLINIKNNQKLNPDQAKKFLISLNKISSYIDKNYISTFETIFIESIKSNTYITFKKQYTF